MSAVIPPGSAPAWAWARRLQDEAGFSLVEELVTVAVIGLALVLLVGMLTTGAIGVTTAGSEVQAETLATSQLELVKNAPFSPDPTAVPYPSLSPPPRFGIGLDVSYWDSASGTFISTVQNEGLQKITVTITHDGDTVLMMEDYKVER